MIRISMPIDYGSFANSTSLNLIARKMYLELGKLMNNNKSFVISATLLNDSAIGNVNQHYDCISIPNMGGYRFPLESTVKSNNLIVGIVGIDEVVLGREVYKTENDWLQNKPIIENPYTIINVSNPVIISIILLKPYINIFTINNITVFNLEFSNELKSGFNILLMYGKL